MDLSFKTNYSILFIPVVAVIAAGISYLYYKRTRLEGGPKKLFIALRFLSMFFILMLLLSPVISFLNSSSQKPLNVFLIDNSQSLLIDNRASQVREAVKDKIAASAPGNSDNLYFLFSGNLFKEIKSNESDAISFEDIDNFETNASKTLYSLSERLAGRNVSSITIISDGIINEGGNPSTAARSFNVPVNYIITGDTIQKNDLVLKDVFYNKSAFIESSVPVNVHVNSYGYDREIKVELFEEGNLLESRSLRVTEGIYDYDLSFTVSSSEEKIARYRVQIEPVEGEITQKNNFREFFIKFRDNKFKVLVLAGSPSSDAGFITGEIKKIKNFEAEIRTQKSSSEYYEGTIPPLNGFDCFVLIGYPTAVTDQNFLLSVRDAAEKNNSAIFFFASRNTDLRKLALIEDKLPFKVVSVSENEELTGIRSVNMIDNDFFKNGSLINSVNSFPNIFKTSSTFGINSYAETFLVMNRNSEPALVIQNTDKNRSAAFLAYGLYKWRLTNSRNNAEEVLSYLLAGTIASITNKDGRSAFTIETTKPVYSKFENVRFEARIMNHELKGGEQIRVRIKGEKFSAEVDLTKTGSTFFQGEINVPADGTYEYTAELLAANELIESTIGKFAIGENNFEYLITKADNTILNLVSNETGGKNFTGQTNDEIRNLISSANDHSRTDVTSRSSFELNVNPYYLAITIFLLCLEWFFRKRNSLP